MIDLITNNLDAIRKACEDHDVKALWVFGSAANGNWVEGKSDVDFLVELGESDLTWFKQFLGLYSVLEDIAGTPIDLVDAGDIRSDFFAQELTRDKVQVYERVRKEIPA